MYFRVILDGQFFAYLCCADNGWMERDGESRPPALIGAIGDYIRGFYEYPVPLNDPLKKNKT